MDLGCILEEEPTRLTGRLTVGYERQEPMVVCRFSAWAFAKIQLPSTEMGASYEWSLFWKKE